ncbi:DUF3348 domain-containing protein [Aquabacterium sp. OR-4]|uniref:DUF3348 domain-containing protein n=1 Tax=Aquabacterium sp. OR-4 TaxID=2978127 RepID=UPI0021B1EA82|nr:DUF3348 domain-containing protein [Aquabacterium sp. OR-4]MDT7838016.1 DUF3348 domain-containing protein [Aquabacterium sp. OR-4]
MASAPPRNRFARSTLTRLLSDLAQVDLPEPPLTVAERLGPWLEWTDAIALSTALQAPASAVQASAGLAARAARAAADELARVRSTLSRAITSDEVLAAQPAVVAGAVAGAGAVEPLTDFTPLRLRCQQHQRAMTAALGPLRQRVRAALGVASPPLARLAALDAVLDDALAQRERHALGRVPALLERHAERLGQPGQAQLDWVSATAGAAPDVASLGATVQRVLLAELDIRLKPIEGMMEALKQANAGAATAATAADSPVAPTPAAPGDRP